MKTILYMVDSNISEPEFNYSMSQKEAIIDICYFYIDLKLILIKFQMEAGFIKLAQSEIGAVSRLVLMTGLYKDEGFSIIKHLKEVLNKNFKSIDKRKSLFGSAGKVELSTKDEIFKPLKWIDKIQTHKNSEYVMNYAHYSVKPLYDDFFNKFIKMKTTLMKFQYRINNTIPKQNYQLINDFLLTALAFETVYQENKSESRDNKIILCYLYYYTSYY